MNSFTTSTPRVLGISGSPGAASRSHALMRAALQALAPHAMSLGEVALRDLPGHALIAAELRHPAVARLLSLAAQADLVVVATPIYQASFSGLLKLFLDLLPQDGLRHKVVLPLATGGSAAHVLALDYALKPVLSALGARHVLDGVYATDAQFELDAVRGRWPSLEVLSRLERAIAPVKAAGTAVNRTSEPARMAANAPC